MLRCLKRIYGGMLLNMFPVQFMQKKKLERKIARQVLSTTHYDEMHYDEMQHTNVDNHHSYFYIQFIFILYVNIIM